MGRRPPRGGGGGRRALGPGAIEDDGRTLPYDRGVRLTPPGPDGLPLLLLERDVPTGDGDATLALLQVGVGEPGTVVASLPDCGCDACDQGSADLLDAVDAAIGQVVGGPFVVLEGKGWRAQWHPEGGSAGGSARMPAFETTMDLCRRLAAGEPARLPRGARALVGRSWLA